MRAANFARLIVVTIALLAAGSACRGEADDVPSLMATARNGQSVKVRQEACLQLAEAPGEAASDALVGFLADDELWYCSAHGLGARKDSRAVEPLLEHLDPRSPHTHKFVWALGEIGDPSALPALEELRGRIDATTEQGRRIEKELDAAVSKLRDASS